MSIEELRGQIDAIDTQLIALLEERFAVAKSVAQYKIEHQLPILDQKREDEIIQRVVKKCGKTYRNHIEKLYRELFSISRAIQKETGVEHGGAI